MKKAKQGESRVPLLSARRRNSVEIRCRFESYANLGDVTSCIGPIELLPSRCTHLPFFSPSFEEEEEEEEEEEANPLMTLSPTLTRTQTDDFNLRSLLSSLNIRQSEEFLSFSHCFELCNHI